MRTMNQFIPSISFNFAFLNAIKNSRLTTATTALLWSGLSCLKKVAADSCVRVDNNAMVLHQGQTLVLGDDNINLSCEVPLVCAPGKVLILASATNGYFIGNNGERLDSFFQTQVDGGLISFQPDDSGLPPTYALQSVCPSSMTDCGACVSNLPGIVWYYSSPSLSGTSITSPYKVQNPPILMPIIQNIVINDAYPTPSFSTTITFISGFVTGEDSLTLAAPSNNIISNYNAVTGQMTLNAQAGDTLPLAQLQSALASIVYYNTNAATPSINNRTLSINVNDGYVNADLTVIIPVIAPPLCQSSYANQQFYKTQAFQFSPINLPLFVDPQDFGLTSYATQSDGSSLPSWISFFKNLTFAGIAPSSIETLNLKVCANNTADLSACTQFAFSTSPVYPPSVNPLALPLPNQEFRANTFFSFPIPSNAFLDPQNSELEILAQCNGQPLPSWMEHDPVTQTIQGNAPMFHGSNFFYAATYSITLLASNSYNLASPEIGFDLKIDPSGAETGLSSFLYSTVALGTLIFFLRREVNKSHQKTALDEYKLCSDIVQDIPQLATEKKNALLYVVSTLRKEFNFSTLWDKPKHSTMENFITTIQQLISKIENLASANKNPFNIGKNNREDIAQQIVRETRKLLLTCWNRFKFWRGVCTPELSINDLQKHVDQIAQGVVDSLRLNSSNRTNSHTVAMRRLSNSQYQQLENQTDEEEAKHPGSKQG
jgi:hypothetical protein